ncbi:hypothetical protein PHLCEN_2v3675 [Hermanssonia centrifuga]|uniref:DUF6589 domain-containing protein n=1 Tax=Hermanssonia centrifuga TaxID=98765 RepID=A0A2R6QEH7_9APHY|nr:hypothetical protein PHLCEN_2v3675 [Hermanssonia centrifuga]
MSQTMNQDEDLDADDNERYPDEIESEPFVYSDATRTRTHSSLPALDRTAAFRQFLDAQPPEDIARRCREAIRYMADNLKLDITLLLFYISWNLPETTEDKVIQYARTALMWSDELPSIIKNWHRPPRKHGVGVRTKAASTALESWAEEITKRKINEEMRLLGPYMRLKPSEISPENLLSITMADTIQTVQTHAPTMWSLCRSASYTPIQEMKNAKKNPDLVLPRMLGLYFKACGTSAKGLDTLHALGISISQKAIHDTVNAISCSAQQSLRKDILQYPYGGLHDNLNQQIRVYEQRLSNQSHFDSGTAATIFIIKDPSAVAPSNRAYQAQLEIGSSNPITFLTIVKLDHSASHRLRSQAIFRILSILKDAPPFGFNTYEHKDSEIFNRPPPVFQLPTGPLTAITQYMLDTIHIDQSSYEGNEACLGEWNRQTGQDSLEAQKKMGTEKLVVWIGDQLTTSRIRGIKRYHRQDLNASERYEYLLEHPGWFHTQITEGHSFHNQYYGTSAALGLKHDFDLLKRKGLGAPSTQGNFHHNINEALTHIAEARFRDLWCVAGGVQTLNELQNRSPEELEALANQILDNYASTRALDKQRSLPRQDDILIQAIQFNRDILPFLDLDDAIKTGDVGRIRDLLPRLLFRFIGGGNSNYVTECLELLQGLEREWPEDLKQFILKYCWLANTTGRPGLFLPFDMLQEHNIRDIKHTFASMGPYATWDYIKRISASIPTQRRIKDHVEHEINHFFRGKSHTSPEKEEDVALLQSSYSMTKMHYYNPRRQLHATDKVEDYIAKGADFSTLKRTVNNWAEKRKIKKAKTEDWTFGYNEE